MKKGCIIFLCLFIGFLLGAALLFFVIFEILPAEKVETVLYNAGGNSAHYDKITKTDSQTSDMVTLAFEVAEIIQDRDYTKLSSFIHPTAGVVFTPYSTVDLAKDQCFTASEIAKFAKSTESYIWGTVDGQNEPIEMNVSGYFNKYVYDADYAHAKVVGINSVVYSGNSLENVSAIFPGGQFVDLCMPGTAQNDYTDWKILRIVFEEYDEQLKIVAIIHSQWTV